VCGAADPARRVAAVGDRLRGGLGGLDGGEHEARGAEVQRLLGPDGAGLREAEHGGGARGVQRAKAGERLGDPARPVLHVDDDVVVAGEGGELGEGRGEGEEEQTVQGVSGGEAGLEGGRGREEVGCRGGDRDGGAPPTEGKRARDAVGGKMRGVWLSFGSALGGEEEVGEEGSGGGHGERSRPAGRRRWRLVVVRFWDLPSATAKPNGESGGRRSGAAWSVSA
jgi:hypothetical protein